MIERMDRNVVDAQRREREKNNDPSAVHSNASEGAGTKKWVLMGKKGTTAKESNEDGPEGLRVDQYLVVFLKFMSSIGKLFPLFSVFLL
jgi:ubiquitin-like-conjugating enzyme ATG3